VVNMSVDTSEDFALVERIIVAAKNRPVRCSVAELLALRERCLKVPR